MTPSQLTRLKQLHVSFGKCLEFAQDCHSYANVTWDWKYSEGWRKDEQDAKEALAEFEELIAELEGE